MTDPAIVNPPTGKFTEAQMKTWPQHAGVRRAILSGGLEYEDQYMIVRSLNDHDARNHFASHNFEYRGKLAFNVPFHNSPSWLINLSLAVGRWFGSH